MAVAVGNGSAFYGDNLSFTTSPPWPFSGLCRLLSVPVRLFNVTVAFTAPSDSFNAIGLSDFAPAGWTVAVNNSWNTPNSDTNSITNNRADYI